MGKRQKDPPNSQKCENWREAEGERRRGEKSIAGAGGEKE